MTAQLSFGTWAPELDPALSQFHTPMKLARRMVEWAGVELGMCVLEPSAGGGNIVRALIEAGARVVAVEIDSAWAKLLKEEFPLIDVLCVDFMELGQPAYGPYDLAVMNPPLTQGVGADHVAHALELAPRAVSILRSQDFHGVDRYNTLWRDACLVGTARCVRRPVFSGTGGKIEIVVADVTKPWSGSWDEEPPTPKLPKWWADDWSSA